ncbi:Apc15p protein-domain-containing protein [Pseudoneurospora amorphoporcata]|uniref:Apc15p protein-domain-containing protein n=1 Tax=Pseudoneurospora amorphoporcata TaxID=241081 RepID=A0AAN6SB64_9PEZI|nr:Apc15p protein-domain-containing protein [Pseudoneurospora amorphoporcata]
MRCILESTNQKPNRSCNKSLVNNKATMFSILPDLAPRDSHSLWYTSSRNPLASSTSGLLSPFDPSLSLSSSTSPDVLITNNPQANNPNTTTTSSNHVTSRNASRNIQAAIIERSLLGRLRADETYMERRKANVSNLGSTWLKPPGVSKTLFQMREEERERQEHEEAMRREEMLARELAEAEAAAAAAVAGAVNATAPVLDEVTAAEGMEVGDTNTIPGGAGGDLEMMEGDDDMNEMRGRDLDEDIPDADEGGFGYDGASDDDEEEDEVEEEEEATTERNTTVGDHTNDDEDTIEPPQAQAPTATSAGSSILRPHRRNDNNAQQQRELANVRANEERMREMMARGGLRPTHINLADGAADEDDDIDEEDRSHMLEEDDIVVAHNNSYEDAEGDMMDDSLGMNANLDDGIPEADEEHAQSGFYEHTDSEAEILDSSDNEGPGGGQEQVNVGMSSGSRGNGGNLSMSGSHRRNHRVSYGPTPGSGSAQGQQQHRRVSLPRQQQQPQNQRLLRTSLAGSARRSTLGAPRSSLDISGLLSVDESSPMMRSSPRVRRMH